MESRKAGVVGLGTMGSNIAIVCARGGRETLVYESDARALEAGMERARAFLDAGVRKGKTTEAERDAILGRIHAADALSELGGCGFVIEAITEDLEKKKKLLRSLDAVLDEDAVIASNTSTLSISRMGAASGRPDRTIGTHFCLPAALNRLVEVAPGLLTSEETLRAATAFLEEVGQTPVVVRDAPGFVLNRFLVAFQNDCIRLVESGYASPADLDAGVRLGLGYRMGPMRLLDIEGLDIHRTVSLSMHEQLGDPRYVPPPLVDRMIDAGRLGAKAGRGFYGYKSAGVFGVAEPEEEAEGALDESPGRSLADAVRKVGVIGVGAMGSGIAQVCASAGLAVAAVEASADALEAGLGRIRRNLEGAVKRGKMDEARKEETLARLSGATDPDALADCDLLIEAIVENLDAKLELFGRLGEIAKEDAVIASNTSCLSVTAMAARTKRPERTLGLHFFNPPYAMRLVEVIEAVQTAPDIAGFGAAFCRRVGKTPILVRDRPGFLVNRLLVPYLNHAAQAFDDGLADRESMDRAVSMGLGHPMGPLALIDLVGADVQTFVADAMAEELGEARFLPPPILRRMTAAGRLGRKTGRGFYEYA